MSTAAVAVRSRWTAEHRFHTAMGLAMLAVVYVGFARSFFLRPFFPEWPSPVEPVFYVHGIAFAGWCVLLVVQASLVGFGRTALHRRVGVLGGGLAGAMVALGIVGAITAAGREGGFLGVPVPPLQFLIVPLFDVALFATFVALAIRRRRDPQAHKRWMLLATLNLLPAAFARWPVVFETGNPFVYFGLSWLFVVALAAWDWRTRGRLHPVTLWGGAATIVSLPLRLALSGSAAWLALAERLVSVAR